MFYTFRQNNSGGKFNGPIYVIIEAKSAEDANARVQNHGVYFDGCDAGRDCNCCGDRWSRVYEYDGEAKPSIYGKEFDPNKSLKDQIDALGLLESFGDEVSLLFIHENDDVQHYFVSAGEVKKLKTEKTKSKPSVWGFIYYTNWDVPCKVFQAFQTDFDPTSYYDISGHNLKVSESLPSLITNREFGYYYFYFVTATKAEAETAYAEFNSKIQKANTAKQDVLKAQSLEANTSDVCKKMLEFVLGK